MPDSNPTGRNFARAWIIGAGLTVLVVVGAVCWWRPPSTPVPRSRTPSLTERRLPVNDRPVIDYNALSEDALLQEMMTRRKARYGIDRVLDLVVTGAETLRVGDQTVSMSDIQRQIALKEGRILETEAGASRPAVPDEAYGIYVVQPGDNLWNIHFALLKSYFEGKGTHLPPMADEPLQNGSSTGVGRLLKFSEGMVYIYNLHQRRLDPGIDAIHPLSKILIYKMKPVFTMLEQIDAGTLDAVRFDGDTLWLPAGR